MVTSYHHLLLQGTGDTAPFTHLPRQTGGTPYYYNIFTKL